LLEIEIVGLRSATTAAPHAVSSSLSQF